jgi:hypothetical protein
LIALAARILHAANEHSHGKNAGSGFADIAAHRDRQEAKCRLGREQKWAQESIFAI